MKVRKQILLLRFSSLLANPAKNVRGSFKKQFLTFSFSFFFNFVFKVNGQMSPKFANSFRMINNSLEVLPRYVLYSTTVLLFNFPV